MITAEKPNGDIEKSITFFLSGTHTKETVSPIAEAAKKRGYSIEFTQDLTATAEIGVYGQHTTTVPSVNAELSIIMFHGIDMGYSSSRWPSENWSRFDVGLLPGTVASQTWQEASDHPHARPNIGVFEVGWPKSDPIFSDQFENEVAQYEEELQLSEKETILYAPTKENSSKVQDFLNATEGMEVNRLIKFSPIEPKPELEELYDTIPDQDNIYLIDPYDPIMYCLSLSDMLVSEQSSVLQEAIFTDTIPVSVRDWPRKKPAESRDPSRTDEQVPDFAIKTTKAELRDTISGIMSNYEEYIGRQQDRRDELYPNLGSSGECVINIVESLRTHDKPPVEPLGPRESNVSQKAKIYFTARTTLAKPYHRLRYEVVRRLSDENEKRLKKLGLHKVLYVADRISGYDTYR